MSDRPLKGAGRRKRTSRKYLKGFDPTPRLLGNSPGTVRVRSVKLSIDV